MSTKGSLAAGSYTEEAVRMARANRDFVIGFIAQQRMDGVGLREGESSTDEDVEVAYWYPFPSFFLGRVF